MNGTYAYIIYNRYIIYMYIDIIYFKYYTF